MSRYIFRVALAPLFILASSGSFGAISPVALLVGRVQTTTYPMNWGTLGESLLKARGTQWYYSQADVIPTDDWMWNERRGYSIGAVLSYKSNGRIRFRANTAAGGTTSRDWATDGTITNRDFSTPNTKHADKERVFRWHPAVVFVSLGTNDANTFRGLEMSFPEHKTRFAQVLDAIQAKGITPFVLISPPRDDPSGFSLRTLDRYLVGEEIERQTRWDRGECKRRGIPYLYLKDYFGDGANPPKWLPEYRADGVHYHLPKTVKKLADILLAYPGIRTWYSPPVVVARTAPLNGHENGNLVKYACFQGPDTAGKTRGWQYAGDTTNDNCAVSFETPPTDAGLSGRVLTLTRTTGNVFDRSVYQEITTGITPGAELRYSGKFRASGFNDMFYDELTGENPGLQDRCSYTIGLRFRDATGADMGPNYWVRPCDSWSIDTDGKWWTFNLDLVVPPGAVSARLDFLSSGTPGLINQNAKFEVANVSLRYLGPGGNGVVYP